MTRDPVLVAVAGGTIIKGYGTNTLVHQGDIDTWLSPGLPLSIWVRWVKDLPSPSFDLVDIVELATGVVEAAEEIGSTKVVVLTGTDAMEEVAFALDLLMPPEFTVVCTGAMHSPEDPDFDGISNLNAALAFIHDIGGANGRTFITLAGVVLGAFGATKVESL
jgi:L-asparaginase